MTFIYMTIFYAVFLV